MFGKCHNCNKELSGNIYTVLVDGKFKDFCSNTCIGKYDKKQVNCKHLDNEDQCRLDGGCDYCFPENCEFKEVKNNE